MSYQLSRHAHAEIERRGIPLALVESVLDNPQQIVLEKEGRKAYQSRVDFGSGKIFLLRVIVIDDVTPKSGLFHSNHDPPGTQVPG